MDWMELVAKIRLDASEYEGKLKELSGNVGNIGQKLGGALGTAAKVGGAALAAASAAAVKFGKDALDTGLEFDTAMSQIAATLGMSTQDIQNNVNGAGETFEKLREKAKQMGSETNFTAKEAAEGLNILAMSGYDAEQSMSMIEDVMHLAAAGSMDMASAAQYVSGAMKGFNDASKDSEYYSSLMAKGATLANTNVQQLGEALSDSAAVASSYGQSADSVTVSLLRLAEQGEVGAAAGTALSAAMKNLYAPTDQAAKLLKELHVEAFDPTTHAARDFNEVVNELSVALENYDDEQAIAYAQTIFGIQGFNAYNKMVVTSVDKQNEWTEALKNSTGEVAKQYETMTDNLQGDIDIFNSALDGLKLAVSDDLVDMARMFVQFGSDSLSALTKAYESGGIDAAMEVLGQKLSEGLEMLLERLPQILNAGAKLLSSLGQGIIDNIPLLVDSAVTIIKMLVQYLQDAIPALLEAAIEIIFELAHGITEALPELIPAIVNVILTIVEILTEPDMLMDLIQAAFEIITAIAQGLIEAIPILIEKAPIIIMNIIEALHRLMPQLLASGVQMVNQLASGLTKGASDAVKAAVKVFDLIKDAINKRIKEALNWGRDLISNFVNGIMSGFGMVRDAMVSLGDLVGSFIHFSEPDVGPLSDFSTYAPDMMRTFAEGIRDNEYLIRDQISKSFDFGQMMVPGQGIPMHPVASGGTARNLTVILELDRQAFGKAVYKLNNEETQRVGVKLAGGYGL